MNNDIPIIVICYGAQLLALHFKCRLAPLKNHTKNHKIFFNNFSKLNFKKSKSVNSFHNYGIVKTGDSISALATANDNSIELFKHKKKKVLGIMWHPERYKNFKSFDRKLITLFLSNKI